MSLIGTDGFKDLCGDVGEDQDDDPGDQDQNRSVFNSLVFHDINGNNQQPENTESKDENSIEDISDDKISNDNNIDSISDEKLYNGQFSLDVNLSQFDRSLTSHVSLD